MENGFPLEKQNSPISHLLCPFAFLLIKKHLRILICDFEIYRAQSPTLNNRWLYFSGFLFHSSYFWHRASIRLMICSTLPPSRQLRSQATSTFSSPCPSTRSRARQRGSFSSAISLIQGLPPHAALTVASLFHASLKGSVFMATSCSDTAPAFSTLGFLVIPSPHIPESICQDSRTDPAMTPLIPPLHIILPVFVLTLHPIFLNLFAKNRRLIPLRGMC